MNSFFGVGEVSIVPLSMLKPHEMADERRVEELEKDIKMRGELLKPIVADRRTNVILDGHCRCSALRKLGCRKVAVKFVDYSDGGIVVEGWNGEKVSKADVVAAGVSGALMKPKTTRHMVRREGKLVHVSEVSNFPTPIQKLL